VRVFEGVLFRIEVDKGLDFVAFLKLFSRDVDLFNRDVRSVQIFVEIIINSLVLSRIVMSR
jgi:hypothetical protein